VGELIAQARFGVLGRRGLGAQRHERGDDEDVG
jgi:hypothetical protein